MLGENPLFLLTYLLRLLRLAALLAVWRAVFAARGQAGGLDVEQVLTYTLLAGILAEPLNCRTGLDRSLWEGAIVTRMLQPIGLVASFVSEMAGRWVVGFAFCSLPMLLLAPWLGVDPWPASGAAAAWFGLSLALAVVVGVALDFLYGAAIAVLKTDIWMLDGMRSAVALLLSGAVVPLALMPWGMGRWMQWLPFGALASAPLQIYTGAGDAPTLLALQAFWATALCLFGRRVWRVTRERMVSYGG